LTSRRPSASNIREHSTTILPMKAMIKENERNRREASVEESKTNLMKALAKVEEEIDKVEKEIKQATRKKEKLEKEEKERQHRVKNREDNLDEGLYTGVRELFLVNF